MYTPHPDLQNYTRRTTWIEADRLSDFLGISVVLACETFQRTGSFKFRAAMNVALSIPHTRVITASSGNFGQALALACKLTGKQCTVVMPDTSSGVKIDGVKESGGLVDLIDVKQVGRAERVAQLSALDPEAYVSSPYDDDLVIAGNSSLAHEIAARGELDAIVAPVGGGGLVSGLLAGLCATGSHIQVIGSEPLTANDAARSLREGRIICNEVEPATIADGARTVSVGERNWAVIQTGIAGIVEVPEAAIKSGVERLFRLANLKTEPTGALSTGALMTDPERFRGKRICCVVSGGNVDSAIYRSLIN